MAEQYRRKALMDIFGDDEADPLAPAPPPPIPPLAAAPPAASGPYTPPPAGDLSVGFRENNAGLARAGAGAMTGAGVAQLGGPVTALGGALIGATSGALKARTNDAKNERETFAQSLGVPDSTALWQKLNTALPANQASELQDRALNRIGKHDMTANAKWMQDVRSALAAPPPAPASPAAAPPVPAAAPSAASAAPSGGLDFSRLQGYDAGKFNDPKKQTAKYQMGRTLAGFDPSTGLTPDVIAALNALGFGSFSGQGDKLSLSGLTDKGRSAGLVGDYTDADFNIGYKTGKGKWGYADPAAEALQPSAASAGGSGGRLGGNPFGGEALGDALNGDPLAVIRAAIAKFSGSRPNAAALMTQLGGG